LLVGIRHGKILTDVGEGADGAVDDAPVVVFEAADEVFGELLEEVGVFVVQYDDLGEDAVLDGVLGRLGFAGSGLGPARFGSRFYINDARGFGSSQGYGRSWWRL
jgi:hypothetical protein